MRTSKDADFELRHKHRQSADPSLCFRVVVVATICKPRNLPASVTAAFVHQVALQSPTEEQRLNLLLGLSQDVPLAADVDLRRLAQLTAVHLFSNWPSYSPHPDWLTSPSLLASPSHL